MLKDTTKIDRATFDNDAEIAVNVYCPKHGKTCHYHATYTDGYRAFAICGKCGWMREF